MSQQDERERLILLSLLEQARAFRKDVEKRLEPMLHEHCACLYCLDLESAINTANMCEGNLESALEMVVESIKEEVVDNQ